MEPKAGVSLLIAPETEKKSLEINGNPLFLMFTMQYSNGKSQAGVQPPQLEAKHALTWHLILGYLRQKTL